VRALKGETNVNIFDKICAVLAFVLGAIFIVLGGLGLFKGCKANFSLPPALGVIPAFVGWGIVKSVYVAWKSPGKSRILGEGQLTTSPRYEPSGQDTSGPKENFRNR